MKSVQRRSFSGLYFPVLELNTEKYWPQKTPYLGTFHIVREIVPSFSSGSLLDVFNSLKQTMIALKEVIYFPVLAASVKNPDYEAVYKLVINKKTHES